MIMINKLGYSRGCYHGKVKTPVEGTEGVYTFCWGYYSLVPGESFYLRQGNEVIASSSYEWEEGNVDIWKDVRDILRGLGYH